MSEKGQDRRPFLGSALALPVEEMAGTSGKSLHLKSSTGLKWARMRRGRQRCVVVGKMRLQRTEGVRRGTTESLHRGRSERRFYTVVQREV